MCQVILRITTNPASKSGKHWRRGDVVEILEDGFHPGRRVVEGIAWNNQPQLGWQILHLTGVFKSEVAEFLEPKFHPSKKDRDGFPLIMRRRRFKVDHNFLPAEKRSKLATRRKVHVSKAELMSAKKNA